MAASRLSSVQGAKGFTSRLISRSFSGSHQGGNRGWKNETAQGSTTGVFVFTPESNVTWPDEKLGVLGTTDPNFRLPGLTGISLSGKFPDPESRFRYGKPPLDVLTAPLNKETQVHALYNAHDYIKYTPGSESQVCVDLLDEFPRLFELEMDDVEVFAHETPMLLRKEMKSLFPGRDIESGPFTTITYSQHTENDMSKWSEDVEEERDAKMEKFVQVAKEICGRLKEDGYWADFIDPYSGTPYYGAHTNTTMFETDEKFRALGFRIEDLGCCKVILHPEFGRNVFVGCIVTDASKSSVVVEEIFEDVLFRSLDPDNL
jgi:hypothetical protein